jgi:RNA polymerase sigma-70 factor (ECF subfamily)
LLDRLKGNEKEAWQRMVRLYGPLIYSWCRAMGTPPDVAQDLVQEVFGAAFRNMARYRHSRPGDSFRGWLRIIARNKVRDHYRSLAGEPGAVGGTAARAAIEQVADPLDALEDDRDQADLDTRSCLTRRAVESLQREFGDRVWQAFWRTTIENTPPADVAEELGVSVWAVYKARARVLRRLREELEERLEAR